MNDWSRFSSEELERRRKKSVQALRAKERSEWGVRYQEICDTLYFKNGPCCAGCDHWISDMGLLGNCDANGIISGADVLKSLNITFSSYMPPPGFPFTRAEFRCGKFQDDFDWQTLPPEYLRKIGAKPRKATP